MGAAGATEGVADAALPPTKLLYFDHMQKLQSTAAVISVITVSSQSQPSLFSVLFSSCFRVSFWSFLSSFVSWLLFSGKCTTLFLELIALVVIDFRKEFWFTNM